MMLGYSYSFGPSPFVMLSLETLEHCCSNFFMQLYFEINNEIFNDVIKPPLDWLQYIAYGVSTDIFGTVFVASFGFFALKR